MGYKTSKAYRDALTSRAKEMGLDEVLAHDCRSEEQQDIMLAIQNRMGAYKSLYDGLAINHTDKKTREYDSAVECINKLKEYATNTLDLDTSMLLKEIEIKMLNSPLRAFKNNLRNKISEQLQTTDASATLVKKLTDEIMKYFNDCQPSDDFTFAEMDEAYSNLTL